MLNSHKTKNKILEASLHMLNETGFGSLTISEVARRSGVSKQNLFYHYPNMEDVFHDLIVQWSETGQKCTLEALAQCNEMGARRVLGMIQGMFLWMRRYPDLSRLGLVIFQTGTKIDRSKLYIENARQAGRDRLAHILRGDTDFKNVSSPMISEIVDAIHAAMYGSFLYLVAMDDFKNLDTHEKNCNQIVIRILSSYLKSR